MYLEIYNLLEELLFTGVDVVTGSSEALWLSGISMALVSLAVLSPCLFLFYVVKRVL